MRELYLSFIAALIRFWDNRFVETRCRSCETLETEIARLRADNSRLVDRLINSTNGVPHPPAEDINTVGTGRESNFDVIRSGVQSWSARRRQLERDHRKPNTPVPAVAVEELENSVNQIESELQ